MIVSFFLAWCITNLWGYVLLGVGLCFKMGWAVKIGGGYVALLYMPFFIEKPITIAIAIFFHRILFGKVIKKEDLEVQELED